jgi:Sec-independent protein translocase protein TatA
MISLIGFLLFLGLIVFGPRKTIEFAQEIGRVLTQVKQAAGQLGQMPQRSECPRPADANHPQI